MPTSFRSHQPNQDYLFQPLPWDWLSEGHLAYFIEETEDRLDLSALYARYEGDEVGSAARRQSL